MLWKTNGACRLLIIKKHTLSHCYLSYFKGVERLKIYIHFDSLSKHESKGGALLLAVLLMNFYFLGLDSRLSGFLLFQFLP